MSFPATLDQIPSGATEAINLIAEFDRCFLAGFANLNTQQQKTLTSLCRVFTGTPLQQPLTHSCAAIQRHEFLVQHFAALAAARAALQGSLFDKLQQQARAVLGRTAVSETLAESPFTAPPSQMQVKLESCRHWLMEIALIGFARLDAKTLNPFIATLEQIQAEPLLMRQAALLTGFFNEMISCVPIADSSTIPLYRWVDLWTQGVISGLRPVLSNSPINIPGSLELLGLDLRHHANLVSFTIYGLLTTDTFTQLVHVTMSAYKVDAISGDEIWLLFPHAAPLLDAFAQNQVLELTDIPMLPTGDLLWNGNAKVAGKYDLLKKAATWFSSDVSNSPKPCLIHPADRHPVQLAEPIFLVGYKILASDPLTLSWDDAGELPVATERLSPLSELTVEAIAASSQIFGLLRFDAGRWAVQPLAITQSQGKTKPKTVFTGQKAADILKKPPKLNTVAILQERASRLLRDRAW